MYSVCSTETCGKRQLQPRHRHSLPLTHLSVRSLVLPVIPIHFVLLVELAGSVTVERFTRWILTACVHCIRWRRWHCFFLYHFRLFFLLPALSVVVSCFTILLRFFLVSFFSLQNSQPNHRSAFVRGNLWLSRVATAMVETRRSVRRKMKLWVINVLRMFNAIKIRSIGRNESETTGEGRKEKHKNSNYELFPENILKSNEKWEELGNRFARLLLLLKFMLNRLSWWLFLGYGVCFRLMGRDKSLHDFIWIQRRNKLGEVSNQL